MKKKKPQSVEELKNEIKDLNTEAESLRKQVYRLQLEKDVLEKAAEVIKKDQGITLNTLTNREKAIVHSDRGAHYRWPGWIERVENAKLTRSMSKKGCSPDNSACEGFFGGLSPIEYRKRLGLYAA